MTPDQVVGLGMIGLSVAALTVEGVRRLLGR